ncbi:hypothetical protein Bca101_056225 [Brassica carinata]
MATSVFGIQPLPLTCLVDPSMENQQDERGMMEEEDVDGTAESLVEFVAAHHHRDEHSRHRHSANLPFPKHQANYHKGLEAAIDAVDRACRLCVDSQRVLSDWWLRCLDSSDTFLCLISQELSKLFPSIPLVAEEDSLFLLENNLVSSVVSEVISKASVGDDEHLTDADVLEAIDRGGAQPLTWAIRMKVAIGAAKGLTFLHNAKSQVIYRDFKAANILLDAFSCITPIHKGRTVMTAEERYESLRHCK